MSQKFSLYLHSTDKKLGDLPEDLSKYHDSTISDMILSCLLAKKLDITETYIALGNYGDVVTYKNGEIDKMSDSG